MYNIYNLCDYNAYSKIDGIRRNSGAIISATCTLQLVPYTGFSAYLKSWFIVDVIAVGPEYITHTFYSVDSIMVLLIDCILKFTRVIKFMRLFNNIQEVFFRLDPS